MQAGCKICCFDRYSCSLTYFKTANICGSRETRQCLLLWRMLYAALKSLGQRDRANGAISRVSILALLMPAAMSGGTSSSPTLLSTKLILMFKTDNVVLLRNCVKRPRYAHFPFVKTILGQSPTGAKQDTNGCIYICGTDIVYDDSGLPDHPVVIRYYEALQNTRACLNLTWRSSAIWSNSLVNLEVIHQCFPKQTLLIHMRTVYAGRL